MATTEVQAVERVERLEQLWAEPSGLHTFLTTVNHKKIGTRYLITAFAFFVLAGIEALTMRTQLAAPELRLVAPKEYNQLFSMHGITMIFLFVTPMLSGFGNYFVPLLIGARDMAFPRMNALSYWIYLCAGLFIYTGLFIGQAPNAGWFNYTPLSERAYDPNLGPDFYIIVLPALGIVSTIVPTFARRPMVAQTWLALATMATGFIGFGVWVHHMF